MAIKAVVFDFDGTLMDTETCAYDVFAEIYGEHGQRLPLTDWERNIGTHDAFDVYGELERLTGRPIDRKALKARFEAQHVETALKLGLLPGVMERLEEARRSGLTIGLASSSNREWIESHLRRQGIRDYFSAVCTSDDVERVKPDPALYRLAVRKLGVRAEEAVAVEDSVNGLRAAKAAGLFAVAVPNRMTARMDFSEADLVADGMNGFTFAQIEKDRPSAAE
ncbi:HAD family hydrolase [Cohnella suwonensis]|uniref:HAD family hydrolase n=1 Tax=Cohnella suwonensis TaxID=696072 RepID=A0ABW0M081_9BACL